MTKRRVKQNMDNKPPVSNRDTGKVFLIALILAYAVLGIVYWVHTPYGASPDENAHGRYVEALADTGRLPVFDVNDYENFEFHQPPLCYALGVPFLMAGRMLGMENPVEMVRLLSLLLGGLLIWVVYLAIRTAFPNEKWLALASASFTALLPTQSMLSSAVSNDTLTNLVFGLALLVIASVLVDGVNNRKLIMLGAILGLGLLTKTTSVLLFPIAVLAILIIRRRTAVPIRVAGVHAGIIIGVALIVGGWWLARNQMLYGDLFALSKFDEAFEQSNFRPEFWLNQGWSWTLYFVLVATWTFQSFWGVFGHMNVFMPNWIYYLLAVLSLLTVVSSIRLLRTSESLREKGILLIYGTVLILVVFALIRFNLSFFQAQGRYLYPALVPIAFLWVTGMAGLLPERVRHLVPVLVTAILLLVQFVALTCCIIPRMPYYS